LLVVKDVKWGSESSEVAVVNVVFDQQLMKKLAETGMTISMEDEKLSRLSAVLTGEAGSPLDKINSVTFSVLNGPIREDDLMMDNYDDGGRMDIPPHQQDWSETLEILKLAAEGEYLVAIKVKGDD